MIEVAIVDDHPPLRIGIKQALERDRGIRVVGEANDGREMLSVLHQYPSTDILLLDIEMHRDGSLTVMASWNGW